MKQDIFKNKAAYKKVAKEQNTIETKAAANEKVAKAKKIWESCIPGQRLWSRMKLLLIRRFFVAETDIVKMKRKMHSW